MFGVNRTILDWLALFSAACWPVCFWWMHRISQRQNAVLKSLERETKSVRKLAKEEQEVIQEIEPRVKEIAEKVDGQPRPH
jgi:hypothetical protein